MDGRFILDGRHVTYLTRDDVKIASHALVAAIRGKATVSVDYINQVPVVQLRGPNFNLYIRGEDWAKILPYLANGTFNPIEVATAKRISTMYRWEAGDLDLQDSDLFNRVSGILKTLFTKKYPT